jgi:threonine dehydrogenase-like Zn-dependent dehydrogenase
VIATSRSASKILLLKQLGANDVIDTVKKPAWEADVRARTEGKGVNHILESVGGESVQSVHRSLGVGWPYRRHWLYGVNFSDYIRDVRDLRERETSGRWRGIAEEYA